MTSRPPHLLLAVGPALMGLRDLVDPPLFPDERQMLIGAIVGLGALCTALGARALFAAGLPPLRLLPLGLAGLVVAAVALLPTPEGGTFATDLLLRLGPALATVCYGAFAVAWHRSRATLLAFAAVALTAIGDVLIRPLATEWMVAASLDEGWGPFGPQAVGVLAFDLSPLWVRLLDGAPLLIVPALVLAARGATPTR